MGAIDILSSTNRAELSLKSSGIEGIIFASFRSEYNQVSSRLVLGEVAERLNALVLKTSEPLSVPRVRISLSPPNYNKSRLMPAFSCLYYANQ